MSYRCGDELATTPANPANPACSSNPLHVSHFYSTNTTEVEAMTGRTVAGAPVYGVPGEGYQLDGIEGYIFSKSESSQPRDTKRVCRRYSSTRDDYVLFLGAGANGTDCTASSFEGGTYSSDPFNTDWIGWAYSVQVAGPICGNGVRCEDLLVPDLFALD
jgi:hypothetical protein